MKQARNYWNQADTAYLRKAYSETVNVEEIATHLNRSIREIYGRAKYLNIPRGDWKPVNKTEWSDDDIAFIKKNFSSMTNVHMAKAIGKTLTVFRNKCRELGLLHLELEYWTTEQVDFLKSNYRTMGDTDLADHFESVWPKNKKWTMKHIEKKRKYLGLKRSLEEQFLLRAGRFNADDYKDFDGKKFKQGAKRLWFQNGKWRWMIKVGDSFVHLHRYNWEMEHGSIPEGSKLFFIDGDTTNHKLSNLICLSRSELARRVSNKNHEELSDSYIAGILSWRNPDMKKHVINHPGIIDAKRQQILHNRSVGLSRCNNTNTKSKAHGKGNL